MAYVAQIRDRGYPLLLHRVLKSGRMSSDFQAEVKQAISAMQASCMARCCGMRHSRLPTAWGPLVTVVQQVRPMNNRRFELLLCIDCTCEHPGLSGLG